ncbi:hypothetical protein [Streptomyces sp. SUK 48]|uniref:hypothetical protein n=1 Tax=Streptomyces sp. SUK 48 TaxID=2582831 RepID=UPI00129A864A|nr:hypothetical protein [Streptomyces sp. SUK 48]
MTAGEPHAQHGVEELCARGRAADERALRAGRFNAAAAHGAPCPERLGLLQPTAALGGVGRARPGCLIGRSDVLRRADGAPGS